MLHSIVSRCITHLGLLWLTPLSCATTDLVHFIVVLLAAPRLHGNLVGDDLGGAPLAGRGARLTATHGAGGRVRDDHSRH